MLGSGSKLTPLRSSSRPGAASIWHIEPRYTFCGRQAPVGMDEALYEEPGFCPSPPLVCSPNHSKATQTGRGRNDQMTRRGQRILKPVRSPNLPVISTNRVAFLLAFRNHKAIDIFVCVFRGPFKKEGGSAWGQSFSDFWGLSFSDSWGLSFSDSWGPFFH